jgi:hypothetical protein
MHWDMAIERRRVPLIGHVARLFAKIGLAEGVTVGRVSKPVYREVLGILRKAEAAVRRLIVVAARNIVLEPPPERPPRANPENTSKDKAEAEARPKRKRRPSFNLFDPVKRLAGFVRRKPRRRPPGPRITIIDLGYDRNGPTIRLFAPPPAVAPVVEEKEDDGMVDVTRLVRRLLALADALQDIPRQALRLARWQARPKEERRPERWSPLRTGAPPGYRQRAKHEVDEILKECHWLARSLHPPLDDTS